MGAPGIQTWMEGQGLGAGPRGPAPKGTGQRVASRSCISLISASWAVTMSLLS